MGNSNKKQEEETNFGKKKQKNVLKFNNVRNKRVARTNSISKITISNDYQPESPKKEKDENSNLENLKNNTNNDDHLKNVEGIKLPKQLQKLEIKEFEEIPGYLKEIEEIWKNTEEYTDSPILKLPVVLVWEISLYLNPKEIISWESTCKHFR